jgi:hypothetical protein
MVGCSKAHDSKVEVRRFQACPSSDEFDPPGYTEIAETIPRYDQHLGSCTPVRLSSDQPDPTLS